MRTGGAETGGVINFLVCQGGSWVSVLEADAATGTITASKITGLSAPTGTSDAVNKAYVDTAAAAGGSSGGGTCYYTSSGAGCGQGFSLMPGTPNFGGNNLEVCCSSGFFADDTVPNSFDISDAEIGPNDLYISAIHKVSGITEASITVGGDGSPQYRLCNDATCANVASGWSASERTINESQYYQVRNTSSASSPGTHTASLVIGDATATWNLTTPAGPDPFSFGLKGIGPSDDLDSDIVHITGLYSAQVSVSGQGSPRYRICADSGCSSVRQPWGSAASLIDNGEYLQARATASSTAGQTRTANITVGDTTETWDFIAGDPSFTGSFAFAACAPGGTCTSNTITVDDPFGSLGLPYAVTGPGSPILVVNGTPESNTGTFDHGDTVAIRMTASSTPGETHTATVTSVGAIETFTLFHGYLVIDHQILATTLFNNLGNPSTWTQCAHYSSGQAISGSQILNNCGGYQETIMIDVHSSSFSGAYVNFPFNSMSQGSWIYHPGFYFSSVSGRASHVYHRDGSPSASGEVRMEVADDRHTHINNYKSGSQTSFTYYDNNGEWGDGSTGSWNLVNGASSNTTSSPEIFFYGR